MAIDCLRSIEAASDSSAVTAIVVDNASGDGSLDEFRRAIHRRNWDGWVSVCPLERNGGFASGNNAAIRHALAQGNKPDYFMFLNPDTVVLPGAIDTLVQFMDSHPVAGIVGSRLQDAFGTPQASAHNAPSPLGELEGAARLGVLSRMLKRYAVSRPIEDQAQRCDWISGASFMVRPKVFVDVGLLDEGYFLYFEEVDFCMRARNAGWTVWYVPDSRVVHLEGAVTGIRQTLERRPQYWYDSRRRYFIKHFGVLGLLIADGFFFVGRISLALRRFLKLGSGGPEEDPKRFALDILCGDFRALITGDLFRILRRDGR